MNRAFRLCLGLGLLGVSTSAFAQQVAPPNIHFLIDDSGSMRELPQVVNSLHSEFFNITTAGCFNPRLDAMAVSRGWNPDTVYSVPDTGTGLGADNGFPNLFQDSKFYAYMYWGDSANPAPQWNTKEDACQSQVANWNTTDTATYNRCLQCLNLKGYFKVPGTIGRDTAPLNNLNFIFWGRFLNFNPPKNVTIRAVLKQVIKDVQNMRVGMSAFTSTSTLTTLLEPQNPSCSQALNDVSAFDSNRASYINAINTVTFTTGTPLGRSLLNIGYYFTSDSSVYRTSFGFGSYYAYPAEFQNYPLTSQGRSVCWGCQHNAVVIVTDGEPSSDTFSSSLMSQLRAVNGGPVYCPDSEPCASGPAPYQRDKGTDPINPLDDNNQYMLDDVAKLLHNQDLQVASPPVVGDFDTSGTQNLTIHTVGFGINSNLLKSTAAVGGGLYFSADNATALKQALQSIVADVQTRAATCTYYPPQ